MRPLDQLPSTYDVPPIMGAQDDALLECLKRGRDRVLKDWTASSYIDHSGAACAYGSVLLAAYGGLDNALIQRFVDEEIMQSTYIDSYLDPERISAMLGKPATKIVGEVEAARVAKEAIELLTEVTKTMFPWSDTDEESHYIEDFLGPFEAINQVNYPNEYVEEAESKEQREYYLAKSPEGDVRQGRVIAVYDKAIEMREGVAVA